MKSTLCTLTGPALRAEATRLAIPGRSRMTADDLRAAVARVGDTIRAAAADLPTLEETVATISAQSGRRDVPQVPPQRSRPAPFRSTGGKRKRSLSGRIHRRTI